jgi:hypothetical protein
MRLGDLVALDEGLTRLTAHDAIKAEVVKPRFFAGLTMPEVARALDLTPGLPTTARNNPKKSGAAWRVWGPFVAL